MGARPVPATAPDAIDAADAEGAMNIDAEEEVVCGGAEGRAKGSTGAAPGAGATGAVGSAKGSTAAATGAADEAMLM